MGFWGTVGAGLVIVAITTALAKGYKLTALASRAYKHILGLKRSQHDDQNSEPIQLEVEKEPIRLEGQLKVSGSIEVTFTNQTSVPRLVRDITMRADGEALPRSGDVRRFKDEEPIYGPFEVSPHIPRIATYSIPPGTRKLIILAKVEDWNQPIVHRFMIDEIDALVRAEMAGAGLNADQEKFVVKRVEEERDRLGRELTPEEARQAVRDAIVKVMDIEAGG